MSQHCMRRTCPCWHPCLKSFYKILFHFQDCKLQDYFKGLMPKGPICIFGQIEILVSSLGALASTNQAVTAWYQQNAKGLYLQSGTFLFSEKVPFDTWTDRNRPFVSHDNADRTFWFQTFQSVHKKPAENMIITKFANGKTCFSDLDLI